MSSVNFGTVGGLGGINSGSKLSERAGYYTPIHALRHLFQSDQED